MGSLGQAIRSMRTDPNAASARDSGIFGLDDAPDSAGVVLVPAEFEATTSGGQGTVDGPRTILKASRELDLRDLGMGDPWRSGIAMDEPDQRIRRASDAAAELAAVRFEGRLSADALATVNRLCAQANDWIFDAVRGWLGRGKLVGLVGGDHGVSFGAIAAHAERHPGMGILHIDAHADLRRAFEGFDWSHASIMHNVMERLPGVSRIVQVGLRDLCEEEQARIEQASDRIIAFFDEPMAQARFEGRTWGSQVEEIVSALPEEVYVSFDIDGLEPALCPGTGTPVPGGLGFNEAVYLIASVARSGRRIIGFDLVEVAPAAGGDGWDGNVGARILYKLIGWSLRSQGG
jgi:agmatinase